MQDGAFFCVEIECGLKVSEAGSCKCSRRHITKLALDISNVSASLSWDVIKIELKGMMNVILRSGSQLFCVDSFIHRWSMMRQEFG